MCNRQKVRIGNIFRVPDSRSIANWTHAIHKRWNKTNGKESGLSIEYLVSVWQTASARILDFVIYATISIRLILCWCLFAKILTILKQKQTKHNKKLYTVCSLVLYNKVVYMYIGLYTLPKYNLFILIHGMVILIYVLCRSCNVRSPGNWLRLSCFCSWRHFDGEYFDAVNFVLLSLCTMYICDPPPPP